MHRRSALTVAALVLMPILGGFRSVGAGPDDPPLPPPLGPVLPEPTAQPAPPVDTPAPAPAESSAPPAPPAVEPPSSVEAATRAVSGMGMYIWRWDRTGSVDHVVDHAVASGISHLVVRASSQSEGFYLAPVLAELLPKAHAAGLKVVAYDPPRFEDVEADAQRALALATFRSDGHGIDAFAADIEPKWELLTAEAADRYGARLRELLGDDYPMVGIVYPPNQVGDRVPFAEVARHFDVLSPMSYHRALTLDGPGFTAASVVELAVHGKPVSVLGQAFDYDKHRNPALRGHPTPEEFRATIAAARDAGAIGMSYWVWEHAQPWVFDAIREAAWPGMDGPGYGTPLLPPPVPEPPPAPESQPGPDVGPAGVSLEAVPPIGVPEGPRPLGAAIAALIAGLAAVATLTFANDIRLDASPQGFRMTASAVFAGVLGAAELGAAPILASRSPRRSVRSVRGGPSGRPEDSGR